MADDRKNCFSSVLANQQGEVGTFSNIIESKTILFSLDDFDAALGMNYLIWGFSIFLF